MEVINWLAAKFKRRRPSWRGLSCGATLLLQKLQQNRKRKAYAGITHAFERRG
jgi:hypothetical protein